MSAVEATPQALYRFFDAAGVLLYIGVTMNPAGRWQQHRKGRPWWSDVASVTIEHFDSRIEVERAERRAIVAEVPLHNRSHHPSRRSPQVDALNGHEVVGATEIAAALGVSRQRVHQLRQTPGFPTPAAKTAAGRIWRTADVVKWAEDRGREIHE